MKKKLLFLFAVLALRGSPQSGDIDTLCYLHHTTHFIPEYATSEEVFNIHTKFYPQQTWQAFKVSCSVLLANGIYYYQYKAGNFVQTKKWFLLNNIVTELL